MSAAEATRPLQVLIADDHPPTRDDVRRAVERAGAEVCAEAANAAEAVRAALESHPDICLLDINMPGKGIAAVWEISARLPMTKIVMLTVSEDEGDLFAALRAGAVSYLVKDIDLRRLPEALKDVHDGKAAIPRALVARMVTRFHGSEPRFRTLEWSADGPRLTSREWEVLAALGDGLSTRSIAQRLGVEQSSVRVHITALVRKLGVANRDEAVELLHGRFEG
jgi:two-component system nitrate/nitrite response regulator NarL